MARGSEGHLLLALRGIGPRSTPSSAAEGSGIPARGSTTLTPRESGQTSSASSSPMLAATMSTSWSTSSRVMQRGGASRTTWPRA
jgi:hypothetical protein